MTLKPGFLKATMSIGMEDATSRVENSTSGLHFSDTTRNAPQVSTCADCLDANQVR